MARYGPDDYTACELREWCAATSRELFRHGITGASNPRVRGSIPRGPTSTQVRRLASSRRLDRPPDYPRDCHQTRRRRTPLAHPRARATPSGRSSQDRTRESRHPSDVNDGGTGHWSLAEPRVAAAPRSTPPAHRPGGFSGSRCRHCDPAATSLAVMGSSSTISSSSSAGESASYGGAASSSVRASMRFLVRDQRR